MIYVEHNWQIMIDFMVCQLHKNIYKKVHNNQWTCHNGTTKLSLRGYKQGGNGREKDFQNGNAKLTLEEIAKQLGTSKTNLTRALRIERNLTDSMKELLDTGEITKTFASDTIVSLIKQTKTQKENINMTNTDTAQADTKYAGTASKDNSITHSSQLTNPKAEPCRNFMDTMGYYTVFGFLLAGLAYELAHEKKITD